jgi:hypothetical protein
MRNLLKSNSSWK